MRFGTFETSPFRSLTFAYKTLIILIFSNFPQICRNPRNAKVLEFLRFYYVLGPSTQHSGQHSPPPNHWFFIVFYCKMLMDTLLHEVCKRKMLKKPWFLLEKLTTTDAWKNTALKTCIKTNKKSTFSKKRKSYTSKTSIKTLVGSSSELIRHPPYIRHTSWRVESPGPKVGEYNGNPTQSFGKKNSLEPQKMGRFPLGRCHIQRARTWHQVGPWDTM